MSNEESEDKNSIKNESEKKDSEKNESDKNDNESEEKIEKNKKEKNKNDEIDDEYKSEEDDDYSFSEEEKKHKKKKMIGNKRKRNIKKKKNKKEKTGKNFFLEGEAEENEEEDSYGSGEVTKEQQEKIYKKYDDTHLKKKEQLKITDDNEEEIAKRYDQKVNEQTEEEDDYYENIGKRPKMSDPKLWLIKCKIGEEKEILNNLFHKFFHFKSKEPKDRLKIFSIISYDNLKGKIFVEAFNQRDVVHAISGMTNVNPNSIQIIPIDECTKIFEYDKYQKIEINRNQLVRIKHGNYEGDLAKVVYIEDPINKIYIELVPRIYEYSKNDNSKNKNDNSKNKNDNKTDNSKNKNGFNVAAFSRQRSTIRPRQKLFDENRKYGVEVTTTSEIFGYCKKCGKNKFRDGLLIRAVRISSLETENIYPKEEELQKLGCNKDKNGIYRDKNNEKIIIISHKNTKNIKFKPGNSIRFTTGEFKGITGTVVSQEGNKVIAKLDLKDVNGTYEFQSDMMTINFRPGEIVYVKSGENKGKNGIVIKYMEDNNFAIYDEITQTKFIAKNTDLILSSEMKFNNDEENSTFKIGDLVRIKNSNIICYIIESSKFILKGVTSRNEIKKISSREIEKINLNRKTTYVDSKQNPITPENIVKVINGPYKGNKGTIKCIYRKLVFLHNINFNRTNGIFCEINDNLEILGSELLLENSEKGKVNIKRVPNEIKDLIGKTVHVIKGNWKGYNGILIDANDKFIKLELSAKQKTIQLPFSYISEGDVNSAKDTEGISLTPNLSMKTPAYYIESHKI